MALVGPAVENTQPLVYKGEWSDWLDSIDDEGRVEVPDGSSLGVEHDLEYIEDH